MRDLQTVVKLPVDDYLTGAWDINNDGVILAQVFHHRGRTGVESPGVLRPGAVSGRAIRGQWELSIGAPPGVQALVDKSSDFKTWTALSPRSNTDGFIHTESLQSGAQFFRVTVRPESGL
jgi:hypothetical protein